MKLARRHVKMIVLALAIGIALAAWVRSQDGKPAPCVPEHKEERDSAGNIVKIVSRTCIKRDS